MPKKTEETVGLVAAFAVLIAEGLNARLIVILGALVLVVLFLFKLTWGKDRVHTYKPRRRRR